MQALHIASVRCNARVLVRLLGLGANQTLRDREGRDAAEATRQKLSNTDPWQRMLQQRCVRLFSCLPPPSQPPPTHRTRKITKEEIQQRTNLKIVC